MGEFPDPAIHGDSVPITSSDPLPPLASSASPTPLSTETFIAQQTTTRMIESSTEDSVSTLETSVPPETSARAVTSSRVDTESSASTTSASSFSSMVTPTSTTQPTRPSLSTSTVATTPILAPSISTLHATSTPENTGPSTTSLPSTSTRPIITPTPTSTRTPGVPTELVSSSSHLSFGEIVGVVALVTVVLAVFGFCVVMGPRRILKKARLEHDRKEDGWQAEDGEKSGDEGGTVKRTSSDWWSLRAPAGALGTRISSLTIGGPGMAGVGAGGRTVEEPIPETDAHAQGPNDRSPGSASRRSTVRSGWFTASMVRGASLLSLGSMLKPEPATTSMNRGGSAGRRFQELYRRERASEMGERQPSTSARAGHYIPARGTLARTSRVPYPAVKRPSRLGAVPATLVQDATLPSLSSASHVTGHGYDADVERA